MKVRLQEHSLERTVQEQALELERRRKELVRAEARIRELEEALEKVCDYADVCRHSPGADVRRSAAH